MIIPKIGEYVLITNDKTMVTNNGHIFKVVKRPPNGASNASFFGSMEYPEKTKGSMPFYEEDGHIVISPLELEFIVGLNLYGKP